MNKLKKLIALLICMSMIFSFVGCSSKDSGSNSDGGNGASADTKFSWWIYQGDSSYYSDYRDNPVVNYLLSKTWGAENKKMDLEFMIPVSGAEKDNFNTLLATGEYPDIMDLVVYTGSVAELYNEGISLDITEYVENYMPNYLAYLDAHPDLKATAMNIVDGEKKYLGIYNYSDGPGEPWGGFQYRRDWIVKYGKNPSDGSAFSGAYTETNADGTPNVETWKDNVIFPSGGSDPIYISDWEWMMEIFQRAIEDQGITDGYCLSLPYYGFYIQGDIVGGFGGSAWWNLNPEGKIEFGPMTDGFRTYLQCMSTWNKNGWLDKSFSEHVNDQFYAIDDAKVRSGKVGIWYGLPDELGGNLDNGEGYLDGFVGAGAPQPINDIYGTAEQQNKEPFVMYQDSMETSMTIITDKAKEKDLPTLFTMLDYLYSEEGSILKSLGLNKEQYEEIMDPFYTEMGLTEGAYTISEDGTYRFVDKILNEGGNLGTAVASRLTGLVKNKNKVTTRTEYMKYNRNIWIKYTNTGTFKNSFISQLSEEDATTKSKIQTNCQEFCSKNIPGFILGDKDPYNDDDWNSYLKAISKYSPEKVTQIYQNLYDSLK